MTQYRVWFEATAAAYVDVEFDGELNDDTRDEITELAYEQFSDPSLCHHCARKLDIGEFEVAAESAVDVAS